MSCADVQYHRSSYVPTRYMEKREDTKLVDPYIYQHNSRNHRFLHYGRGNIRIGHADQRRYQLWSKDEVSAPLRSPVAQTDM
jgi:hypothetical protein